MNGMLIVEKVENTNKEKKKFEYSISPSSREEFLNFSPMDILGWIILCGEDCPVYCRM